MRYAKIREMDISNGEGIGVSLFVQGCHFHCKGCFNQETWDFSGGKEWTKDIEDKFVELAGKPYIERISILGGEPLAPENLETVFSLIERLKSTYPEKKIWLYTGYTLEEFFSDKELARFSLYWRHHYRQTLTHLVDVIVDGRFEIDKQDLFNEKILWAGSTNQRVLRNPLSTNEEDIKF